MGKAALTEKQQRFCDEYLIDLNGSAAYRRAGYSAKGNAAEASAARLLRDAKVKEYLAERMKARSERTEITQDRVLQELARIAFFDPRKLFDADGKPIPINQLDDDTAAALNGLDVMEEYAGTGEDKVFIGYTKKYKVADKNTALTNAMKHLKMLTDKVEASGPNGGPIPVKADVTLTPSDAYMKMLGK